MERTNFENLQIYKLSEKLSDQLWKIVVRWDALARDTVGKQLVRAVDSIGANIAEGSGRGTDPEIRRFLRMAQVPYTKRNIGSDEPTEEGSSMRRRSMIFCLWSRS